VRQSVIIYLFACSIIAGFMAKEELNLYQKFYSGLALSGASVIAIWAINISLDFLI